MVDKSLLVLIAKLCEIAYYDVSKKAECCDIFSGK